MPVAGGTRSPSPIPTTEINAPEANGADGPSAITEEAWRAMDTILRNVYAYRDQDGHDVSKIFHRRVNKRANPDYYDVIKEPMAMSVIKLSHNAQVYNRPQSQAYEDALALKPLLESELKKIVDQGIVSAEVAAIPHLGDIPPASPLPPEEEVEEEDEDDEDEEDEDADDSDDEGVRRRRRRGPRSTAAITKREGGGAAKGDDTQTAREADLRRKRGRPPRVDTPMEARIKAVLKGLRKFKGPNGELKVNHFEKLPDKAQMPEYFEEIKVPMAFDVIKKKAKRKKYQSVDHFMKDVETMFENAKMYNRDDSQIYKDAVDLQFEARHLAEQEKKKPDSEYTMEDGRLPLPNGILHNGELWKVGDWVHIQNPNDVTKPIVAQIYRTWQDSDGQQWVNACWYYRPEQTVHRFERHFYENEVVKTGQYRDHHIDEVVDRCFVMFFTRYNKGRPRGFPHDKDVYVCESRYNEEKYKLNKIKTWASCLPDEVREKDYEMDLFDQPKKMKKVPSPIKHLLSTNAKETDDIPKPTWGVANAPPIVGAVHKRPREPNESPPPEPTPSPPPQPPPPPVRQAPALPNQSVHGSYATNGNADVGIGLATPQHQARSTSIPSQGPHTQQAYNHQYPPQYNQQSASPAPAFQPSPQPTASYTAQTPHPPGYSQGQTAAQASQYMTPHHSYGYHQPTVSRAGVSTVNAYNPPKPIEVYHLSDAANHSIPEDIREKFHRDEHGRILFFTAPPLDPLPPVKKGDAVGHSVRYLAQKQKHVEAMKLKRKRDQEAHEALAETRKKVKKEGEEFGAEIAKLKEKAIGMLEQQMVDGTLRMYKRLYGERWKEGMKLELDALDKSQDLEKARLVEIARSERKRKEREFVSLKGPGVFLDDVDARF
ncbi:hypothetical protein FGG08_001734 [Glutinoglossum americanum]|uniref:Uncharacterized protein n=1 Tax=Glutinoglossum americanum TaxID=1670608 RepID=A0A9P8I1G9_9PEZI|nr:hypothetical protein FGG08_001734 [Glutinoglossum americanum]